MTRRSLLLLSTLGGWLISSAAPLGAQRAEFSAVASRPIAAHAARISLPIIGEGATAEAALGALAVRRAEATAKLSPFGPVVARDPRAYLPTAEIHSVNISYEHGSSGWSRGASATNVAEGTLRLEMTLAVQHELQEGEDPVRVRAALSDAAGFQEGGSFVAASSFLPSRTGRVAGLIEALRAAHATMATDAELRGQTLSRATSVDIGTGIHAGSDGSLFGRVALTAISQAERSPTLIVRVVASAPAPGDTLRVSVVQETGTARATEGVDVLRSGWPAVAKALTLQPGRITAENGPVRGIGTIGEIRDNALHIDLKKPTSGVSLAHTVLLEATGSPGGDPMETLPGMAKILETLLRLGFRSGSETRYESALSIFGASPRPAADARPRTESREQIEHLLIEALEDARTLGEEGARLFGRRLGPAVEFIQRPQRGGRDSEATVGFSLSVRFSLE